MSPTAEVAGVDSFELLTLKMGEAVADVEATDADAAVRVVRRGSRRHVERMLQGEADRGLLEKATQDATHQRSIY